MSTMIKTLEAAKAERPREKRRGQRKTTTTRGKVLSLMRAIGEWMAVVAAFSAKRDEPVLSKIVPVADLKGSERRKADRWVEWLA